MFVTLDIIEQMFYNVMEMEIIEYVICHGKTGNRCTKNKVDGKLREWQQLVGDSSETSKYLSIMN